MQHGGNVWEDGKPEKWLDFSSNLRPEGMPDWVKSVLSDALADARYYPDRTMRAAICGLAEYAGCAEENILPTAGGAAAIDLVIGDGTGRVIVKMPTFGEYAERARVHGRNIVIEDTNYQHGDAIIRCNPNNPSGEAIPREEMLQLYHETCNAEAELVVDEAFADYCPEVRLTGNVRKELTVVGSLTKILCIPGIRLGYVCASPEKIERLKRRMLPWSLNALAAAVAAALPEHIGDFAIDRDLNSKRCTEMKEELEKLGIEVFPSSANFLLCRFPQSTTELVTNLKAQGILVRTCTSFGLNDQYLRFAVRTEKENRRLICAIMNARNAKGE